GARVELYRVQREGRNAYHIATTQSRQERDSYLGLHVLTLGGSLARHDITTVLDGTGAELILNGLYVLGGSQHADHHTVIDHAQPHCASHEFFNGDRKSTRLNSSHLVISYAVFCLKKKKNKRLSYH